MLKQIIITTFAHFLVTVGAYVGATMGTGTTSIQHSMSKYAVEMMQASRYLSQPAFDLALNTMADSSPFVGPVLMINSLFWGILLVCVVRLLWLLWN